MRRWQQQRKQVLHALTCTAPVELDDLLLPRDLNGALVRKMAPDSGIVPREAAALVLLYPHHDELWLPLTARSPRLLQHSGEVSLPGGAADPEDDGPVATALRETDEEVGVSPEVVEIWGELTTIYIPPSNFRLTPIVGFTPSPPVFRPCPIEIAEVFTVALSSLMDPATVVVEEWDLKGKRVQVPFFALNGYKVWGATALVLSELVIRMQRTTVQK